jgi:hypothetical protein
MAFPSNPTNLQVATVNNVIYVYNSTKTAWNKLSTVAGTITANSLVLNSNTQSTSTTTGALQVTGGVGINTGNLYIGGSAGVAIVATGNIIPSANLTSTNNLGSDTRWWNNFYGVSTQARYADLAENYQADNNYEPGTVLIFGGCYEVTVTAVSHNIAVAGVVSTNPAHLMNSALRGENVVPLALQGRVPCKVKGPVNKGTVLVSSDIPGVAEAVNLSMFKPGCVIGKSLENIESQDIKMIEVVVGRF